MFEVFFFTQRAQSQTYFTKEQSFFQIPTNYVVRKYYVLQVSTKHIYTIVTLWIVYIIELVLNFKQINAFWTII